MTKNTIFGCGKWAVIGKPLQTEFFGADRPCGQAEGWVVFLHMRNLRLFMVIKYALYP
jgi:hypothetical protein